MEITPRLVLYPESEEILYTESDEIEEITPEIVRLAHQLANIMYEEDAIGISAPQVGIHKRLIVIDCSPDKSKTVYLINPEIIWQTPGNSQAKEACLSYPGLVLPVSRPKKVKLVARDLDGEKIEFEASGLYARCLCHEVDHLNGTPFTRRVSRQVRRHLMKKWIKRNEEL